MSGGTFPRRARRDGPRCPPRGTASATAPRRKPGTTGWFLLLPGLLSLREVPACHPLPPRSPRPGTGLPGAAPPAGAGTRRAGDGAPRARASGVLPGYHPGRRKGVCLPSQQGEFPSILPPSAACPEGSGWQEGGEGKKKTPKNDGKERGAEESLLGGKLSALKANVTPRRAGAPSTAAPGRGGAAAARRGPPLLPGATAEPGRAGARGAERGSPQPTGTRSWPWGVPPVPLRAALLAPRWGGDPGVPRTGGTHTQSEVSLSGGRSVSQAPVTERAGKHRRAWLGGQGGDGYGGTAGPGSPPSPPGAGRAPGTDRRDFFPHR